LDATAPARLEIEAASAGLLVVWRAVVVERARARFGFSTAATSVVGGVVSLVRFLAIGPVISLLSN
jgi:hypothetical protein